MNLFTWNYVHIISKSGSFILLRWSLQRGVNCGFQLRLYQYKIHYVIYMYILIFRELLGILLRKYIISDVTSEINGNVLYNHSSERSAIILDEMFLAKCFKFAILLECKDPCSFFPFFISCNFIFSLMKALVYQAFLWNIS